MRPPLPRFVRIESRMVCVMCEADPNNGRTLQEFTWPATPEGLRKFTIHMSDVHRHSVTSVERDGITNA